MFTLIFFAFLFGKVINFEYNNYQPHKTHQIIVNKVYSFRYDAQTSISFVSQLVNNKKSLNRLQATVDVVFTTPTKGLLQLRNCSIAQLIDEKRNNVNINFSEMQPINFFKKRHLLKNFELNQEYNKLEKQLLMPVKFEYSENKLIENIQFLKYDEISSRNLKKAILNLLQVNTDYFVDSVNSEEGNTNFLSEEQMFSENTLNNRFYKRNETTIEGDCETSYEYSITPNDKTSVPTNKLNVTKVIHFDRCKRLPDVDYGFVTDSIQPKTECNCDKNVFNTCSNTKQQNNINKGLNRSTVLRYVLSSSLENNLHKRKFSQNRVNNFGIESVEILSNYTTKLNEGEIENSLQTIAIGQLFAIKNENDLESLVNSLPNEKDFDEKESIMYNAIFELTEKAFVMNGDNEFPRNAEQAYKNFLVSEKENIGTSNRNFINKLFKRLNTLISLYNVNEDEISKGLNGLKTAEELKNVVEAVKKCTVKGLRDLLERATSANKNNTWTRIAQDIFADVLTMAATKNSITVLVEMIMEKKIDEIKTLQSLQSLNFVGGLLAPSELKVDEILRLCKSNKLEWNVTKQTCWLTFGTMVGTLRQQSEKAQHLYQSNNLTEHFKIAAPHKMDLYAKILTDNLKNGNEYDKIVALKAIGNAGLETTIDEIVNIIKNNNLDNGFRLHAVNTLHHICNRQPKNNYENNLILKIYSSLIPFLKNIEQNAEIRSASAAMLLTNAVSSNLLKIQNFVDQIIYIMYNDMNKHDLSFVNEIIDDLSKSSIILDQIIADQLRKLTKTSRTLYRYKRIFFYSNEDMENNVPQTKGLNRQNLQTFLHYIKIYTREVNKRNLSCESTNRNALSKFLIELEIYSNDSYQRQSWLLDIFQDNFELILKFLFYNNESNRNEYDEFLKKNISFLKNTIEQINHIFGIIKRHNKKQHQNRDFNNYAILTLRYNNKVVIALPLKMEVMQMFYDIKFKYNAEKLKVLLIKTLRIISLNRNTGDLNGLMDFPTALSLQHQTLQIPSSVGMPIKINRRKTLFGFINFNMQQDVEIMREKILIHQNMNYLEEIEMRCWLSSLTDISSGMSSTMINEFYVPIDVELQTSESHNFPIKKTVLFNFPQQRTRIYGLHSFTNAFMTYKSRNQNSELDFTTAFDSTDAIINTKTENDASDNKNVDLQKPKFNFYETQKYFNFTFHFYGYNILENLNFKSDREIINNTNKFLHVDFVPIKNESPTKIKFTIYPKLFEKIFKNNQTHNFYSWDTIHSAIEKKYNNLRSLVDDKYRFLQLEKANILQNKKQTENLTDKEMNAHEMAHQFLEKNFNESKNKFLYEIIFETIGKHYQYKAELEVYAICDYNFYVCESNIKMSFPNMYKNTPWTLDARIQNVYSYAQPKTPNLKKQLLKTYTEVTASWGILRTNSLVTINMIGKLPTTNLNSAEISSNFCNSKGFYDNLLNLKFIYCNNNDKFTTEERNIKRENITLFLNQFDIFAQYEFHPVPSEIIDYILKPFTTKINLPLDSAQHNYNQLRNLALKAFVCVYPNTQKHATVLLETLRGTIVYDFNVALPNIHRSSSLQSTDYKNLVNDKIQASTFMKYMFSEKLLIKEDNTKNLKQCSFRSVNNLQNKIDTFNGILYDAPFSNCFTILAKDCSTENNQPKYTILIKKFKNSLSNEKTVVIIRGNEVIQIEPSNVNSKVLKVILNYKTYTEGLITKNERLKLAENFIYFGSNLNNPFVFVGVLDTLIFEFNGRDGHILLNSDYQNSQCGFCGFYNDNRLLTNNSQTTGKVDKLNRLLSLQNNSDCSNENIFYFNKKLMRQHLNENLTSNRFNKSNEEQKPILKTVLKHYNRKSCFSLTPVNQCMDGWSYKNSLNNVNMLNRRPIAFACFDRMSTDAKRLTTQIRQTGIADMWGFTTTYIELLIIPDRCIKNKLIE